MPKQYISGLGNPHFEIKKSDKSFLEEYAYFQSELLSELLDCRNLIRHSDKLIVSVYDLTNNYLYKKDINKLDEDIKKQIIKYTNFIGYEKNKYSQKMILCLDKYKITFDVCYIPNFACWFRKIKGESIEFYYKKNFKF